MSFTTTVAIFIKKAVSKLIFTFLLASCVAFAASAQNRKPCDTDVQGDNIYKHYSGTIGQRKVMVDLRYGYCGASNYGGSYVYDLTNGTVAILMIGEPESFMHGVPLTGHELSVSLNDWGEGASRASWNFTIAGDRLTGKWHSADKKQEANIDLKEDYRTSYSFDMVSARDSAKTMRPGKPMLTAQYSFFGAIPSSKVEVQDANYIKQIISGLADGTTANTADIESLPSIVFQKNTSDFTTGYKMLPADTSDITWKYGYLQYTAYTTVYPIYNNDGIVALEYTRAGYFDKFNEQRHVVIIDVKNKKVLNAENIFVSKEKLVVKLKELYKKQPGAVLSLNDITADAEFMVSASGIVFWFRGQQKPDAIYVPYTQIADLLTKDFRKRMKL